MDNVRQGRLLGAPGPVNMTHTRDQRCTLPSTQMNTHPGAAPEPRNGADKAHDEGNTHKEQHRCLQTTSIGDHMTTRRRKQMVMCHTTTRFPVLLRQARTDTTTAANVIHMNCFSDSSEVCARQHQEGKTTSMQASTHPQHTYPHGQLQPSVLAASKHHMHVSRHGWWNAFALQHRTMCPSRSHNHNRRQAQLWRGDSIVVQRFSYQTRRHSDNPAPNSSRRQRFATDHDQHCCARGAKLCPCWPLTPRDLGKRRQLRSIRRCCRHCSATPALACQLRVSTALLWRVYGVKRACRVAMWTRKTQDGRMSRKHAC